MNDEARQVLNQCAAVLGEIYTSLLMAGWKDDAQLDRVKAARDAARKIEAERTANGNGTDDTPPEPVESKV